jgi:hypothetical protein
MWEIIHNFGVNTRWEADSYRAQEGDREINMKFDFNEIHCEAGPVL